MAFILLLISFLPAGLGLWVAWEWLDAPIPETDEEERANNWMQQRIYAPFVVAFFLVTVSIAISLL